MTAGPRGARRIADIPADHLRELSEGRAEAGTLVEWLAADTETLLRHILPAAGRDPAAVRLLEQPGELRGLGVTARLRVIGAAIAGELGRARDPDAVVERLLAHPSNFAREWLGFALCSRAGVPLERLLEQMRPLAADRNMGVRETAWLALRAHLAAELPRAIELLVPWVHDPDANIRRFAVEGTRPRGVWSPHIPELKADPAIGLPLLEPVRSDPSDYVRRSVGNWLNDASKSRPEWVERVCARWLEESASAETAWICRHGLRTLRKRSQ